MSASYPKHSTAFSFASHDPPGVGVKTKPPQHTGRWLAFVVAWALSAALAAHYLKRGWWPHDAGTLAQSAERVLYGELPHRDFDEVFTGGVTFLHALAFRIFGTSLVSLRFVLFAFFLAWVP